jgi:hypothetical protein
MTEPNPCSITITAAAAILASRAQSILAELESAALVLEINSADAAIIRRAADGAEECALALADLAAGHEEPAIHLAAALSARLS